MFRQKNKTVLSDHFAKLRADDEDEEDGDILVMSRRNHDLDESHQASADGKRLAEVHSKRKLQKLKKKAIEQLGSARKFVFDEESGEVSMPFYLQFACLPDGYFRICT